MSLAEGDVVPAPCPECGGTLRVQLRDTIIPKPVGTFSLSGQGMKVSATVESWPWAVCDSGDFEKAASRG